MGQVSDVLQGREAAGVTVYHHHHRQGDALWGCSCGGGVVALVPFAPQPQGRTGLPGQQPACCRARKGFLWCSLLEVEGCFCAQHIAG